jgi:hypothetical protein
MVRNLSVAALAALVLIVASRVVGGPDDPSGDPTEGAHFVGSDSCKKCHFKEHRSWKATKHSEAWTVLQPHLESPDRKDGDGRLCISCHVTGFGEDARGGFVDASTSAHLLGVQCESCHGAGSKHIEAAQKVLDDKRKKFDAGEKTFTVLRTTNCANCHNPHKPHAKMD